MNHEEDGVTLESIDAALETLVKSVEATGFEKAYGGTSLESGGHVDERGKTSGGYADKGDIGGIDNMMIGKMVSALADAGYSADAISAFMSADEGEDEDEDEGEDEDEESAKMSGNFGGKKAKPFGKSYDAMTSDPAIADAIDVSPYLDALVHKVGDRFDDMHKSQARQSADMARAVYGIGQLVKSLVNHAARVDARLGYVEQQPARPRGAVNAPQAKALAKSFGALTEGGGQQLQKSDIKHVLTYMNLEKGIKDIEGRPTSELVGLIEGGNMMPADAVNAVSQFLSSHPSEASRALRYR